MSEDCVCLNGTCHVCLTTAQGEEIVKLQAQVAQLKQLVLSQTAVIERIIEFRPTDRDDWYTVAGGDCVQDMADKAKESK